MMVNPSSKVHTRFLFFALIALGILDTIFSKTSWVTPFNMSASSAVLAVRLAQPWLTDVMVAFTFLGSDPVLFLLVIVLAAWAGHKRYWRDSVRLLMVAAVARIMVFALKSLVASPRPDLIAPPPPLHMPRSYGFPSGHALMSMAILGSAAAFIARHSKNATAKVIVTVCCVFLILGVGISRIYVGAHWLNDVLGGYLFGGCVWILSELYADE